MPFYIPPEELQKLPPEDLLQIYDGIIFCDKDDMAAKLQKEIREYVEQYTYPSVDEADDSVSWCRKMQRRTEMDDPEGFYRWHWLLTDSLQIYCDIQKWFYFGPKKTLRRMSADDPIGKLRE